MIGIALNGTSSVLYGSVPDLVTPERRARAFSIFYTGSIGAGALAPALFGIVGDLLGVTAALVVVACVVLLTLPLALILKPFASGTYFLTCHISTSCTLSALGRNCAAEPARGRCVDVALQNSRREPVKTSFRHKASRFGMFALSARGVGIGGLGASAQIGSTPPTIQDGTIGRGDTRAARVASDTKNKGHDRRSGAAGQQGGRATISFVASVGAPVPPVIELYHPARRMCLRKCRWRRP